MKKTLLWAGIISLVFIVVSIIANANWRYNGDINSPPDLIMIPVFLIYLFVVFGSSFIIASVRMKERKGLLGFSQGMIIGAVMVLILDAIDFFVIRVLLDVPDFGLTGLFNLLAAYSNIVYIVIGLILMAIGFFSAKKKSVSLND